MKGSFYFDTAPLPWSHNLLLMSHNLSPEHVVFYANEVFRCSYSLIN